jgi:RNA polymerase sigma-70 factor (ECF subfamily)
LCSTVDIALGAIRVRTKGPIESTHEQVLLDRCRKRDLDAFAKIVDAYQTRILGFLRRMLRDEDDALDLAQEVFLRAFQSLDSFDGRSSLRSWLFTIAYNLCVDRARRRARSPKNVSMDAELTEDGPCELPDLRWDPAMAALHGELSGAVESALESMSDKLKSVLLMHDREDMGYEEIARAVNVPVGTVKSRLFLARAHLKRELRAYLAER